MIGIGIDTGGTCTDVVVYEQGTGKIYAAAKEQTTHRDLKVGIGKALAHIPPELRRRADYVALSTTLATNACVEGKGARAGLILIGAHPKAVERYGAEYGLPDAAGLCLLPGRPGEPLSLDRPAFQAELKEKFSGCGGIAVVQIDPQEDGGALERQAAQEVTRVLSVPCVLGSELFQERNVLRRGASALLNARLRPVMEGFLEAIRAALEELGLSVPVWIVRSDGTLMSRAFAAQRPVETLLCGPAASVIGGQFLARAQTALIADMGGTTTDVSVVRDGFPVAVDEGIQIGPWRTMVHGVYIHTVGLGGDSRVMRAEGGLALDKRRCIPLCALAAQHPELLPKLEALAETRDVHTLPLYECFTLLRPPGAEGYTREELALCRALEGGPLTLEEAAKAIRGTPYAIPADRLEREGVVLRAGLTPTDILHLRGQYAPYDRRASSYAARWLGRCLGLSEEELCSQVETLMVRTLYCHLVRVMLESRHDLPDALKSPEALEALAGFSYQCAAGAQEALGGLRLETPAALVGIGAPTHFYLPQVAQLMGAQAVLPQYGGVANALGAAVSCISAQSTVEIRPKGTWEGPTFYQLTGGGREPASFPSQEQAEAEARRLAQELAVEEARRRGALGELRLEFIREEETAPAYDSRLTVVIRVGCRATAVLSQLELKDG